MILLVITDARLNPETGEVDEAAEKWESDQVSFMTEPSGALVVFKSPGRPWAAYAPGAWRKVRDGGPN